MLHIATQSAHPAPSVATLHNEVLGTIRGGGDGTLLGRLLDEATVTDQRSLRIVHGHGTGQLRRAIADLLRSHPLVAHFETAPQNQGGGGATVIELKD